MMCHRFHRVRLGAAVLLAAMALAGGAIAQEDAMSWPEHIQLVLDETKPLEFDRAGRLPLYLWPAMNPGTMDDARAEALVRALDTRGVGLVCSWRHDKTDESLAECLPVARAQKKLGLRVNVNATTPMYSFFDGSEETAHLGDDGKPFFDDTFGKKPMGCPFRLEHRIAPMRERIERFAAAYAAEGLPIGFVFADWEIDGPLEWNRAHDASKRCTVCRENLPELDDFLTYQDELRRLRSRIQRLAYAEPILESSPGALVGNYAVYPHDGWRYWYDYFERYVAGQPALADQKARYRHWGNDFEGTGYTFAMPVVYPWSWTWNWYDFEPGDYRWFYNGLLVASNAGRHTPPAVPIIAFVHWHTVDVGLTAGEGDPPANAKPAQQMSEATYQELLWHMLLRGTDTFFLWCMKQEQAKEVQLLHPVYAAAQEYGAFLENGVPITFDVPARPGTVVSGLRMGNEVLVRRTDFAANTEPVQIAVGGRALEVPAAPGTCQVLTLGK
ncbi:MAG: hypothetical protein JXR94_05615 [Candidatus Hydrogenedentes bacterium]|nr:hypothetical protein [Candidatus Hydrogenedentota bacterium]